MIIIMIIIVIIIMIITIIMIIMIIIIIIMTIVGESRLAATGVCSGWAACLDYRLTNGLYCFVWKPIPCLTPSSLLPRCTA